MLSNGSRVAYTRDGSFDFDSSGALVHRGTGEKVLGWTTATGTVDTTVPITPASAINIPLGQLSAVRETTQVEYTGNLSSNLQAGDKWTASIQVYDSLGDAHKIDITFTNRQQPPAGTPPTGAVASFEWEAAENGTVLASYATTGNERLYFGSDGKLVNPAAQALDFSPTNGATPMSISLDFSKISSLANQTQVQPTGQDGFPPGSLSSFSIDANGIITGIFTNGLTKTLGQIGLALFPNPAGLERLGNNLARDTDNSGLAVIGQPNTSGRGSLSAGFLEQSNVDIGDEFTELIVTQRGFQANTRVVTTVDDMLQELLNMKR